MLVCTAFPVGESVESDIHKCSVSPSMHSFPRTDDCNQVTSSTRVCSDEGQVCIVQVSTISLSNTGRVHICRGGQWGLVATENFTVPWSSKNAQVACRQAGFRGGALNSMYPLT